MTNTTPPGAGRMADCLLVAVRLGLEGAAAAAAETAVEHPDGAVALLASLCRAEYVRQVIIMRKKAASGMDLRALMELADAAQLTALLDRVIAGSLTREEAGALCGGRWAEQLASADAERSRPASLKLALVDLQKGVEIANSMKDL